MRGAEKTLLVSAEIPYGIEKIFGFLGYGCVRLPEFDAIDAPVSSHPDMLFYKMRSGNILCDRRYYEKNSELLLGIRERLVFSKKELGREYPGDVLFDTLRIGDTVYGRLDATADEIISDAVRAVNVKQGYARCSCLNIGNAVITADEGLSRRLAENGVDVCLIRHGGIALPGYGEGFIGGASFYDEQSSTVVFFGDPHSLPDFGLVLDFLDKHGVSVRYPEGTVLTDHGSAVLI